MGPAITSDTVTCEHRRRLRDTASFFPHNTHSNPIPPTGMSTDESLGTVQCHSIHPCASSQHAETSSGFPLLPSNGLMSCLRLNMSKVPDNRSLPVSSKPHDVDLKDIQGCRKMSLFLENNSCSMLPNGGNNYASSSGETKTVQTVQVSTCDEKVPCRTVQPQLKLAKLVDSCELGDGIVSESKSCHLMNTSKSQVNKHSDNPRKLEFDSFPSSIVENNSTCENCSPVASEKTESVQNMGSLNETLCRQKTLNLRASLLLRRLRQLQCHEVNVAVKETLGQLASSLGQAVGEKSSGAASQKTTIKDTFRNRELLSLSTAALVVQEMQSARHRSYSHSSQPATLGCLPTDNSNYSKRIFNDKMQLSMSESAGQLLWNMRHLKSALDSDATESSSGGESDDEKQPVTSREACGAAMSSLAQKKLEKKWARDRCSILSRWTWLQAQVSDLEHRIRQQGNIYKQLRLSKGSLSLRDPSCPAGSPLADGDLNGRIKVNSLNIAGDSDDQRNSRTLDKCLVQSEDMHSSDGHCMRLVSSTRESSSVERLTSERDVVLGESFLSCSSLMPPVAIQQQAALWPTMTSFLPTVTPSSGTCSESSSFSQVTLSTYDPTCCAARCMEPRGLHRRTLLCTNGLHEVSRKASHLSTVRCTCDHPVAPCSLCGGRYDRVMRPGSVISPRDRLALLHPSYHSVLSCFQDVPLPLHLAESLWLGPNRDKNFAKSSCRPASVRVKNRTNSRSVSGELRPELELVREGSAGDGCSFGRRIQSAFHHQKSSIHTMGKLRKKKHSSRSSRKRLSKASFRSSSLKVNRLQILRRGGCLTDAALRRQSSCSTFDINNVVIPSLINSAAHVDIIQYKEIITPKWRKVSKNATTNNNSVDVCRSALHFSKRPKLSKTSDVDGTKKVHWSNEVPDSLKHFSTSSNQYGDETDEEEEIENLSDEAFAARHLRYEIYEQKQRMPKRVGQQRHSRSNHSESNSYTFIHPQSPSTKNLDASASFTSSTLSGVPSTSCLGYSDAEDSSHQFSDVVTSRQQNEAQPTRNFSSFSGTAVVLSASNSSEQLSKHLESRSAPAWPLQAFPMGARESLFMGCQERSQRTDGLVRSVSPAASTSTDSTESVEEDLNDPEWTVASQNKDKPGILIKFADV